jgi:hypothetical protein
MMLLLMAFKIVQIIGRIIALHAEEVAHMKKNYYKFSA